MPRVLCPTQPPGSWLQAGGWQRSELTSPWTPPSQQPVKTWLQERAISSSSSRTRLPLPPSSCRQEHWLQSATILRPHPAPLLFRAPTSAFSISTHLLKATIHLVSAPTSPASTPLELNSLPSLPIYPPLSPSPSSTSSQPFPTMLVPTPIHTRPQYFRGLG